MSDDKSKSSWLGNRGFGLLTPLGGVGFGVAWHVWSVYGFWWGVLYGAFWPVWLGHRLAGYLLGGAR